MPDFWYQALTSSGGVQEGWISAPDEHDVEERLRAHGSYLVRTEARARPAQRALTDGRVERKELIAFLDYLASSFEVGIPILATLTDVERRLRNPRLRRIVDEVRYAVAEQGKGLSEALAEHPKAFPPLAVSTLRAGEATGQLAFALRQLVSFLDWQEEISTQLHQATLYPAIVLAAIGALVTMLVAFVFPRLLPVLTTRNVDLPLPTRIILGGSMFLRTHWPLIAVALVVLVALAWALRRTPGGRRATDALLLRIPLVGGVMHEIAMARFVTYLGLFYRTGVEIILALTLVEQMLGNRVIADAVRDARERVLGGETLARAFGQQRWFTQMVVRSVALGEATGRLDEALARATTYYAREIPATVRRFVTALQPLMVMCLGAVILLVALAIFLPILAVYGSIGATR